jgi:ubiquinone/menaquinone biosynthesis C-methylase UbiE
MPAPRSATPEHIKDVNWRYHDAAAGSYDHKWGIDFGPVGQRQVRGKLVKALGGAPDQPFEDALEIGAGTGYFSVNLLQAGLVRHATATDISPGMLEALSRNASGVGVTVRTVRAEAELLPFEADSFDLVFGHAVLHHIPNLAKAFDEFHRVLRPGGVIAFCGEPSRYGDLLAALPKRGSYAAAPLWRRLIGATERETDPAEATEHELEPEVDVHAFAPSDLRRFATGAGFEVPRVRGEELLANVHGWTARTLESTAEPETVPMAWRRFAFSSYLWLQRLDTALLEPFLPPELFYNLLVSARKPEADAVED